MAAPAHPTAAASDISAGQAPRRTLMTPASSDKIPPFLSDAALSIACVSFSLGALASWTLLPSLLRLTMQISSAEGSDGGARGAFQLWPSWRQSCALESASLPWARPQFGVYLGAWAVFHMLEFVITARYNPTRLYADSFLLQNGIGYHIAHGVAVVEFLAEAHFFPCSKVLTPLTLLGLVLMLVGQAARSLAMVHAGNSFSHQVAAYKREDHVLVTTGVYSLSRHPSYFGFFYWALGTQLMLANPVSALGFAAVLYRFFSQRIRKEEAYLVNFFGTAYEDYRKRVPTLLPFV
ncbi:farnesyl cysteine-carboxyl methyltransferase [Tilletia horrida]|nr:farnesyl cysteine-carboxyl methyltransferase [Tilletia horrida]